MSKQLEYIQAVLYNFLNIFSLYTAAFIWEGKNLVYLITGGDICG